MTQDAVLLAAILLLTLNTSAQSTNAVAANPPAPVRNGDPAADEPPPSSPLLQKIQAELSDTYNPPENNPDPSIPHGEMVQGKVTDSVVYPGTENGFQVYVPAQYNPATPACLLVKLDGFGGHEANALDHLIASKEMPITIAVGISPGAVWVDTGDPDPKKKRREARFNRCYEFDSTNDHFPDYVINELLPAVQKTQTRDGRAIRISPNGNDHAATGASSGGIGAFTLAWRRPDQFSRVYSVIGTFVPMRGGNDYPALIRKTEPKPFRIFLEDGSADAWNPLLGSWFASNLNMESALYFSGYDVAHAWGKHGHNGAAGSGIFADVMRWLWRDYPARIPMGQSRNSTLQSILPDTAGWQAIGQDFLGIEGMAANAQGDVDFSDTAAATIYHLGSDDKPSAFIREAPAVTGLAFGPDGTLYGAAGADKKIVAFDAQGSSRTVADGIAGRGILATHDGTLYVSEPGQYAELPSTIWQVKSTGEKKAMDQGISSASGIAFSPDGELFFAAEKSTQWIYSYLVRPDGTFADKQPYYWLHQTDIPNNSGAEAIAVDQHGELYVATNMGIQVCDHNGRVRAILPLPTPCGPTRGLCFGGPAFDVLYATDGRHVFKRKLKIPGVAPWAPLAPHISEGAG
jgi:enterochelin esterase-like enzyme